MSLYFNDTATRKGIVQMYEKEIDATRGFISSDTDRLKDFTADANGALDDFVELAIKSSGTWQFDDSNHGDYPVIKTNIISGQRDYTFTTDETGNLVLDIYKVLVADSSGLYREVVAVDSQGRPNIETLTNGQDTQGAPTQYDKTANGILLDLIPNYNYTNGLKVYVNREASYFLYTDTTKMPGIPGIFHDYLAKKPASEFARRNNMSNKNDILGDVLRIEQNIKEYFTSRNRDERKGMTPAYQNNK